MSGTRTDPCEKCDRGNDRIVTLSAVEGSPRMRASEPVARSFEKGTTTLQVRNFPPELLQRINGIAEFAGADRDALVVYWLEDLTKEHKPLQDTLTQKYNFLPRAKMKR